MSFMRNMRFLRVHLSPSHYKSRHNLPLQLREREHLLTQDELHEKPEKKGGGDEHETIP